MRVLMTADTVGGVWTYSLELVAALAPLGVDVTLATMGAPVSRAQARAAAELGNLELLESRFALEWMPDPWRDVDDASTWLLQIAQRVRPDVVHVNGYTHAALPFQAPVLCVAHSCVLTWSLAVHGRPADAEWDEYRRRVGRGLAAADVVVAPTDAILRAVLDAHGVRARSRVIPNGRSARWWRPGQKEPLVLAAGRLWDEAKGLAELDACAGLVEWPIYVAGPTTGPEGPGLAAGGDGRGPGFSSRMPSEASIRGIGRVRPTGVRLLGELEPEVLATWAGRASIYALPARYEPFGLSVLEAALAGCALVLGKIDSLREVWREDAVYVPPGDPDALGAAINALARDPERRRTLAASAWARGKSLTAARMAGAYRALYEELISEVPAMGAAG